MIQYPRQGLTVSNVHFPIRTKRNISSRQDKFFYLPTVIAEKDPFLQRLYHVVTLVLDDHPYPSTKKEFYRRTYEIEQNVQDLNLSLTQYRFLDRLRIETDISQVDLWQGSHIIVMDDGYLYHTWSKLPAAIPRFSSHYSEVPIQQYGIYFRDHQMLFGKTSSNGSTWLQMEAHGFDLNDISNNPRLVIYHGQDFLKYKFHGMNVGPFGFSIHTETNDPIIRPYRRIATKKRQTQKRILRDSVFLSHLANR